MVKKCRCTFTQC